MPNCIFEDLIEQALVQKLRHLHGFDALLVSQIHPDAMSIFKDNLPCEPYHPS